MCRLGAEPPRDSQDLRRARTRRHPQPRRRRWWSTSSAARPTPRASPPFAPRSARSSSSATRAGPSAPINVERVSTFFTIFASTTGRRQQAEAEAPLVDVVRVRSACSINVCRAPWPSPRQGRWPRRQIASIASRRVVAAPASPSSGSRDLISPGPRCWLGGRDRARSTGRAGGPGWHPAVSSASAARERASWCSGASGIVGCCPAATGRRRPRIASGGTVPRGAGGPGLLPGRRLAWPR